MDGNLKSILQEKDTWYATNPNPGVSYKDPFQKHESKKKR
jgi:hypothetical protein